MITGAAPSVLELSDPSFWRNLCPHLSIEATTSIPTANLPDPGELLLLLRAEGYINIPAVFPSAEMDCLLKGIQSLKKLGLPPAFIFVFDQTWLLFRALAPFLERVLGDGYRQLPAFWAWHVEPNGSSAGWRPHRDRPMSTYAPDNTPDSLTLWVPLTDATPLNGCMYVLPAHLDPSFQHRSWKGQSGIFFDGERLQDIRALPAPAGSLLAWNHALIHWGGRASSRAAGPRCSIALEFQRGDRPGYETPLTDPARLLAFHERLGQISHLTRQYVPWHNFHSPSLQSAVAELEERFYTLRQGEIVK